MLDHLNRPIADLVANLTPAELKTIQDNLAIADTKLKQQKATFEAVLARRFEAAARLAYQAEKKDTGTVNIAASNTLALKVEIDKKVEWDQEKTLAWLNKQTPEDARHFGKLKVEIPEAKFAAATPALKAQLTPLRTVKAGKLKFTLVNADTPAEEAEAA